MHWGLSHDYQILFHPEHSQIHKGRCSYLYKENLSLNMAQSSGLYPSHVIGNTLEAFITCLSIHP